MKFRGTHLVAVVALLAVAPACGVLPPLSSEKKHEWSSHIVVGRVLAASSYDDEKQGHYVNTVWHVDVAVSEFEKGSYEDSNVVVRFWKRKERPPGFVGDAGLSSPVPSVGDRIRAFTTLHDGYFDVLNPNGLDTLDASDEQPPEPATPRQLIDQLLRQHKIVIFSKSYCPYCAKAKAAMRQLAVPHHVLELDQRPDGPQIQAALREVTSRSTVPQVFVSGRFIGGGDDCQRMLASGELRKIVDS